MEIDSPAAAAGDMPEMLEGRTLTSCTALLMDRHPAQCTSLQVCMQTLIRWVLKDLGQYSASICHIGEIRSAHAF